MDVKKGSNPLSIAIGCLIAAHTGMAGAAIQFEDVSAETGMTGFTESWGASWADYNSDNWPDLFNQGHRDYPRFYRNTGEGNFEDIAYEMDPGDWILDPFNDQHGVAWGDYDNDGDQDLLIGVSSTGPAQFLVNTGAAPFENRTNDSDLGDDDAARLPLWFDYNHDGHVDVAQLHTDGANVRKRDPDDGGDPLYDFDRDYFSGFSCNGKLNYGQFLDIDGDGDLEVLCAEEGAFPVAAYEYDSTPFNNVTTSIQSFSNVNNSITGDFNNDLLYDLVLTRGAIRPSGASLVGSNRIEAWMRKDGDAGKRFYFETDGPVTALIDHAGMGVYEASKQYNLDTMSNTLGDAGPVRVQYLADEERWMVRMDTDDTMQAYFQIQSATPITNIEEVDFDTPEAAFETIHLENGIGGLTATYISGLYAPVYCGAAAAADFDNDMDVDVYLVCRRGAENLPNRMYENQGDGTFVEIITPYGGEGPVGAGFEFGVGEAAVIADYDVDGFMDIYLTNGLLYYPIGEGGPDTMLRNAGNGNHWIQIDLSATAGERDALGAKVYVTAGGVTQLREQNGGYTRWSQNDRRIHVGLGANTTADVIIEWPSGQVDSYNAVAADVLYEAVEDTGFTPAVMGPSLVTQLNPGDECGEPPYNLDYGPAVLLWKDCGTDTWSLRAKGGREKEAKLITAGMITADAPFTDITPVNLAPSDYVDNSTPENLDFSVGTWYSNSRGMDFKTTGQAEACFELDIQDIPAVIVGDSRKLMTESFDLVTLDECETSSCHP